MSELLSSDFELLIARSLLLIYSGMLYDNLFFVLVVYVFLWTIPYYFGKVVAVRQVDIPLQFRVTLAEKLPFTSLPLSLSVY